MQPTLRFKEFNDKWMITKLGSYLDHIGSGVTPRGGSSVYQNEGVILIRSQNVHFSGLKLDDVAFISEDINNNMKNSAVKNGDVLLNITGASIGRTSLVPLGFPKANVNQHVCILRTCEKVVPFFLKTFLESPKGKKNIFRDQAGQTREALNLQQIKNFDIGITNLREQQKISDFFTVLDSRIEQQQEKVEAWRIYKKGLMQKLFSRELRFKVEDGKEFPEWEEVKLKDISVSISYGMNAAAKEFDGENIYLRITDIDEESRQFIEKGKVSPNGLLEEKYKLKKGDMLFARTGASTGKSFFFNDEERSFYFAGFLIRVRLKETVDANFVYQSTLTSNYKEWVKIMSMRSGQPGINGVEYGELSFQLPCLKEQQKIAELLSTIDEKIQYETNKVDLFNLQKQAFMQQMFI